MLSEKIQKILLEVQKPGRYVGGELNSVVKDKDSVAVRYAFPAAGEQRRSRVQGTERNARRQGNCRCGEFGTACGSAAAASGNLR